MKEIKSYIDESLFGGKDVETRVGAFNDSLKLKSPKNELDYLNYMCAWMQVFDALRGSESFDDQSDFEAYVFELFFANVSGYHLDISQVDLQPRRYVLCYDATWDSQIVSRGTLNYNKNLVKSLIDDILNKKGKRISVISDLIEVAYTGKLQNNAPQETWFIGRRIEGFRWETYTKAMNNRGTIKNSNLNDYYKIQDGITAWVLEIQNTMMKSPYKTETQELFDVVYNIFR